MGSVFFKIRLKKFFYFVIFSYELYKASRRFFKTTDIISGNIPVNAADHQLGHLYNFLKRQIEKDPTYRLGLGFLIEYFLIFIECSLNIDNLAFYGCQQIESSHDITRKLLQSQNIDSMDSSHPHFAEKLKLILVKFNYGSLREIAPKFGASENQITESE